WLLHVDVLATFHAELSGWTVYMIRGGDRHRVDVFLLLQHDPVVSILLRVREVFHRFLCRTGKVDVAKCHYSFASVDRGVQDVAASFSARADGCQIELVRGCCKTYTAQYMPGDDEKGRCNCCILDKVSPGLSRRGLLGFFHGL